MRKYSLPLLKMCTAQQCYQDNQTKENDTGGMCSIYSREEKYTKIWSGYLKGRKHLKDYCRWEDNIEMNLNERACM